MGRETKTMFSYILPLALIAVFIFTIATTAQLILSVIFALTGQSPSLVKFPGPLSFIYEALLIFPLFWDLGTASLFSITGLITYAVHILAAIFFALTGVVSFKLLRDDMGRISSSSFARSGAKFGSLPSDTYTPPSDGTTPQPGAEPGEPTPDKDVYGPK